MPGEEALPSAKAAPSIGSLAAMMLQLLTAPLLASALRICAPSSTVAARSPDARMCAPDDDQPSPDTFSDSTLAVLSQRLAETKQNTETQKIESMMAAAANWRTGRCAQRAVVVLDEWIRRLHCQDGVLACGTYSGEVQTFDIESGEMLDSWIADMELDDEDDVDQEITAICLSEDAQHVLSGDAAGEVLLRVRGSEDPRLRASHGAAVSGVHWDGESKVYSTGLDGRFLCHDVDGSK